jgi:hypothetical protein
MRIVTAMAAAQKTAFRQSKAHLITNQPLNRLWKARAAPYASRNIKQQEAR